MSRALIIALTFAMAAADSHSDVVEVEWKGIFATPGDKNYTWGAQKVSGKYADDYMAMAAVPLTNHQQADLEGVNGTGILDLATCIEVTTGGLITPSADTCYKLVFDASSDDTAFHVDATGTPAIAFFCQHFPLEFERDTHYFRDDTDTDVEPTFQDPAPGDGHAHAHGGHGEAETSHGPWADEFDGICVCQAAKHGWTLDCADTAHITTAMTELQGDADCAKDEDEAPQSCKDNFYIVQAHHDHCLHHDLPDAIEDALHDYEQYYKSCFVQRQFDTDLDACPTVDCDDTVGMADAVTVLDAGCDTAAECAATECANAMKLVLMAHDNCPQEKLVDHLEDAMHDHEVACGEVLCNSVAAVFNPYDDKCAAEASAATRFGNLEAFFVTMSALLLRVLI